MKAEHFSISCFTDENVFKSAWVFSSPFSSFVASTVHIEPDVVEDSAEDLGGIYDDYSDVDEDIDSDDDVFEYSD